jgi:CRISPR-associated protein Csb2
VLTLEMELLTDVYRASLVDQSAAEWPPHPERVFSALVQAWGDGGRRAEEREALEWLEGLDAPEIEAGEVIHERTSPVVYVPPNDVRSTDQAILPAQRNRQERRFRAVVPELLPSSYGARSHVRFRWDRAVAGSHREPLRQLVHRVSSVGHSSSLARLFFREDQSDADPARTYTPSEHGETALRVAYSGRLEHLEEWYSTDGGKSRERPKVRATQRYASPRSALSEGVLHTVFGMEHDWILLASAELEEGGARSRYVPDVLAFPRVAKCIRNALMKFAKGSPPEVITGHQAGGGPSDSPHLAIVPLANVGWEYSDGALLGAGLVLPHGASLDQRRAVIVAVRNWLEGERGGEVRLGRTAVWVVERQIESERASLRADRYCRAARSWASVTPVFLDRFLKGASETEEVELVARACANVGLPEDELTVVEIHKHSAVRAAETAYPSRGREYRPDWSFPGECSYRNRARRHVVLRFRKPVRGPILLGAGRYHGMGLFLPIPDEGRASRGAES